MESSFVLSIHVYINNVQVGEELSGGHAGGGHSRQWEQLKQRQEGEVWFWGRVSRGSVLLASRAAGRKVTGEDRPMP